MSALFNFCKTQSDSLYRKTDDYFVLSKHLFSKPGFMQQEERMHACFSYRCLSSFMKVEVLYYCG